MGKFLRALQAEKQSECGHGSVKEQIAQKQKCMQSTRGKKCGVCTER